MFWPSKVEKELLKLDINKASGPDDVPALVLKMAAPELATPFARLFQICFDKGYMPVQWKCAHVIQCYEKGDKHTPGNYRPISLLCIMSKVMEKLIIKKMWKHLDQHHLISLWQFGFRAERSISDAVTYVSQCRANSLNNREEARVVCLDISRAFDHVWHPGQLEKLSALGRESGVKRINAGVPQGSILGPLLFIIFIDNISQDMKNQSILYADDATIMSFIKSSEARLPAAAASLNQDLAKIKTWAKTWNVLFGAAKCKTTTISNRRDADGNHPPLQLFGVTLEEADSEDLLGLTLNNNLSWNQVVTKMSKTAGQRLGLLRRVSPYILPAQRAIIYKSMIQSKMEHASSAWIGATPTSLAQLDSIQNRAKGVIGLPTNEYEDYRMQLLSHCRAVGAATLFYRMFYMEAPELLCQLMPNIHVHDPRLRRSVRSMTKQWKSQDQTLSAMQDHFYHLRPNYGILFLLKFQPLDQGPASVSREVNRYLSATL